MRQGMSASDRERLAVLVSREGQLAVAAAVPTTTTTLRNALRGERLQGPTLRALLVTIDTLEGAPAHRLAA